MTQKIIATLVGAIILFIWSFLSWAMLNLHGSETQYTPNQDAILAALAEVNLEEGHYFLPTVPPDSPQADHEAAMEKALGKPWAMVSYHKTMENNMTMNLVRGFAVNLVTVYLLVWLLLQFRELSLGTAVMASLAVGAIGYLVFPYGVSIWFETPTMGYIIDTVVSWGLVGAWLGWYLTRK